MEPEVAGGPAEVNNEALGNTQDSTVGESGTEESMNPAWSPLLDKLPASLHPLVTPELKSWDTKFQEQLQQVHSQYEPYKEFVDNKVPAETMQQAFELYNLINTNPQLVFDQMKQYYGFGGEQGPQEQGNEPQEQALDINDPDFDITQHPKFQELMNNQQMLAQFLVSEQEQKATQAAEAQLDTELKSVKETYPHLDELQLLQTAVGGNMSVADAAKQLNAQYEAWLTQSKRPVPKVFGGGGQLPQQEQPNPAKMSSKETRSTVAAILQAQAEG